jgi:hypothetical protein
LKIEIYPNPASTDITIKVSEPSEVTVVDMQGRTVVPTTPVNSTLLIPHSSLPTGTYFVRILTSTGTTIRKLIIK